MTPRRTLRALAVIAVAIAGAAHGADAPIEFSGVMMADGKTKIALTDKASATTQWLEPGQQFKGFSVTRYDAKEDAVFLKKGGEEIRVSLSSGKTSAGAGPTVAGPTATVAAGSPAPTPAATAAANSVRANLRQLATLASQIQSTRGGSSVSYADLVGPDKPIKQLTPIAGENYSGLIFGPGVTSVSVTMADGHLVALDVPSTPPVAAGTALANASPAATNAAGQNALPLANPATAQAAPTATPATAALPPQGQQAANTTPANSDPANAASATSPATTDVAASNPGTAPTTQGSGPLTPTGREPTTNQYQVQRGDTWRHISIATGVSEQELQRLNGMTNGSSPPDGQAIRIK